MQLPEYATTKFDERPQYVAPRITTLTEGDVLDEVGPAQAYTGNLPFGF